jgi:SAM-dependent methyltransferase
VAFQDHFSRQAGEYTQYRPRYPRALFEFLARMPAERRAAWDCGTGNGQAAVDLAEFFERVVATDPSSSQIAHAESHPRVEYAVAAAENCPLDSDTVDLVTVAQALHWFERDRFYQQVRRVGRKGSVLAVWSYGLASISPPIDTIVWHLYEDILGTYWPPERKLVEAGYATIEFPFEPIATPEFTMAAQWSLGELLGYLRTWSSVQRYILAEQVDPLRLISDDLAAAWGAADAPREVHWPVYLRAGWIHGAR